MRKLYKPHWEFDPQLFSGGSGAGLNLVGPFGGVKMLLCGGDSSGGPFDSGICMVEGIGFSKWFFQLIALPGTTSITGWSVEYYMTIDPMAKILTREGFQNGTIETNKYALPSTSWVPIVALSPESGGQWYNPMTDFGQGLYSPVPAVAVRCVATSSSGTGDFYVAGFATP